MTGIYEALERNSETKERLSKFQAESPAPDRLPEEEEVMNAPGAQNQGAATPPQNPAATLSPQAAFPQGKPPQSQSVDPKDFLPAWMLEKTAPAPNITQHITVNPVGPGSMNATMQPVASSPVSPLVAQSRLGLFDRMEINPATSLLSKSDTFMGKRMVGLYQNVRAALRRGEPRDTDEVLARCVMFMGATYGEGAATQLRDFAKSIASKFHLKTLLIDADCGRAPQAGFFKTPKDQGLDMIVKSDQDIGNMLVESRDSLFHQVGDSSLIICQVATDGTTTSSTFDSPRLVRIINQLRHEVDLILISGPPVHLSPDGVSLAPRVDGIVLIVAAENKRWQVANSAKIRLQENGGNIIGVILNKQQRHIPAFIYKRL